MKVYVANFGKENFAWPQCLARGEVATMQDEEVHPFWEERDRQGYIDYCLANLKTQKGVSPIRSTAGRWFNLGTIVTQSAGDVWLHQDGQHLWWTITKDDPALITPGLDPTAGSNMPGKIYFYRKPAQPWSNKDRQGRPLFWRSLHPKSPDFLVTEATLQRLSDDYAAYALALIDGRDLKPWHDQPEWRSRAVRRQDGIVFSARQRTFYTMAKRAFDTAANANGQTVEQRVKVKNFGFRDVYDLEAYISELFDRQEGLCALSDLALQDLDGDDSQLCCSLDRIDSAGHYERGNLQIVCRFINRWKSNSEDLQFRRLLTLVRQVD
jgi:hypothetical protein